MSDKNRLPPVVTIDGPSGSGKGTVAKLLAGRLNFTLLDSGALYRAAALAALDKEVDLASEEALTQVAKQLDVRFVVSEGKLQVILEGREVTDDIRMERVSMAASSVAAIPGVRAALLQRQRDFRIDPGLVADGRDMGTTVFPDAAVKVYLNASAEERAGRRAAQLREKGVSVSLRDLLDDIRARDTQDMSRKTSPLAPAKDAVELDSTGVDIDEVLRRIMVLVQERLQL